ncbi:N-acyl-D-aspartate/D-glutamate deacylase [Sphingomonas laterariae]|uniref:N-acyl-D-aspartate/D-glutamate deacylase n=1 Tax=Edaphosphingomonas laterariae TaxID=861865 RepID=A0A239GCJ9_9SPHN|nr:amidohydrolase family protein [Sphingomonas laterariae]SNS65774.1 N-acyl-D-aspartate/D-glutamate deacylase [Sphingomonas laterariae]
MAEFDLVLRGGLIADGSGGDPQVGDVAIRGDRIVAVGAVAGQGAREIDVAGRVVAPGFVDIHTHYDGQAIWSDRLNPSSQHGVTTVVVGNCGVGFAPCRPGDHDLLINVMEGVEDIPGVVMAEGLDWHWESFPQYLDALEARPRDIDIAAYLPHSPLRVYAMGDRGAAREAANDDDLARMRTIAKQAIEAGALGFATSRTFIHRTAAGQQIPSFDASQAELEAVAMGLADAGDGIIQAVLDVPMRSWDDEIAMLRAVIRKTGRPATFTLAAPNSGPRLWEPVLAMLDDARAEGQQLSAQVFPRPIGMIAGLELSTNPFSLCPTFQAIAQLPLAEKVARMRDPDFRAKLVREAPADGHPLTQMGRAWDWMFLLTDEPDYEPALDKSVSAIAKARGVTPEEVAYDLLLEDDGHAMLLIALGNFFEGRLDAVQAMLDHPNVVVGLGDGGAHYGVICDASFPTFTLQHWVRDRTGSRMPLGQAVKMLAHDPARTVGLHDRGLIAPGYKADINVIDLDRLRLCKPEVRYDLPAGGRRLDQRAEGYDFTIVSGAIIAERDTPTSARPGRLVRGTQSAPVLEAAE